jgi:hypothetical protein
MEGRSINKKSEKLTGHMVRELFLRGLAHGVKANGLRPQIGETRT